MKQILKGFLSLLIVAMVVVLGFIIYSNYNHTQKLLEDERRAAETPAPVITTPTPTPPPAPEGENNTDITIAVLGDVVVHSGLNVEAQQADGSYNYYPIFGGATDIAQAADYSIMTLETTFAGTGEYTGYPMFKSPDALARGLKDVGFDLVNTASNHSMDALKNGLDRTLDVLDQQGLDHIGTYRTQEERDANNGIVVKDINGVSVAFVSYTYGTNGIPVTGFEYAINLLYKDYTTDFKVIDYDSLKKDMAAARALNTDMIIAIMHWGIEYQTSPVADQYTIADFLFSEGADIILGGHPHVPEPMELRRVVDKDGNEKIGFIVYCLGNFLSCQDNKYSELTAGLTLQIRKNNDTGETYLKHVSYRPLFMVDLLDYEINSSWRYKLWNPRAAIESYEAGNNLGVINDALYNDMKTGLEDIRRIFGEEFDEANGGVDVLVWDQENQPTRLS